MTQTPTVVAAGEILVEFVSHRMNCGLKEIGEYSGPYPAGAPAIFIDQAARMGVPAQMIGGVGQDGFGDLVLNRLIADHVGVAGVTRSKGLSTGVAFVSYYDDGNRDFIFHFVNTAAERLEVPSDLLTLSKTILHVSAASLGSAAMRGPIMALVRDVGAAGGKISCDPNARPELMGETIVRDALSEVMDAAWCLMPSTSDLDYLFPDLSEDAAVDRLLAAKAEIIVVKRGEKGAMIVAGDAQYDFEGHTVKEVDPTGAGDCFGGTFIGLVAQGVPLRTAGEQANAAGAMAVTKRGAMEGNSTAKKIAAFLKQHQR
jgi:sugar/nucleoside kinase (ribokinase family)